jgi:hypothetical protein
MKIKENRTLMNIFIRSNTYEVTERKEATKLPPPELKTLRKEPKYKFLDDTNRHPIIVSVDVAWKYEDQLMKVLDSPRSFWVSMDDLKGISPPIATHQIFIEEGAKLFVEFQR